MTTHQFKEKDKVMDEEDDVVVLLMLPTNFFCQLSKIKYQIDAQQIVRN